MTVTEALGIALAVVGLAFAFETPRHWFLRITRLVKPRPSKRDAADPATLGPKPAPAVAPPFAASSITVMEIVDTINAAPPFQRKQLAQNYSGIRISWEGYLRRVDEDHVNVSRVRVNLAVDESEILGYSFWFSVSPDRLPEIKTMPRNSKLRVAGKILSASGPGLCVDVAAEEIEVVDRAG